MVSHFFQLQILPRKLLQLPPKGLWSLPYLASQGLSGVLSRWLQVPPAIQNLLSETTTPYTEIVTWNELSRRQSYRGPADHFPYEGL